MTLKIGKWAARAALGLLLLCTSVQGKAAHAVGTDDFYGMHVGNDTDTTRAIPRLNSMGVRWVRLWADINWGTHTEHASFAKARALKAAGFKVILLLDNATVPSYASAKSYCDWVQDSRGSSGTATRMGDVVDVWEILNELNLSKYWSGTPDSYVNNVLKAAWDSLHPNGETVLGGSFTAWQKRANGTYAYDTTVTQAYVSAGYLDYCDYAGSHPYTTSVSTMKTHIDAVRAVYGSKPIIVTEWNFKTKANWSTSSTVRDAWKADLDTMHAYLKTRVVTVCSYRLLQSSSEGGWPGFMLANSSYTPYQPFYNMYRAWTNTAPTVSLTSPAGGSSFTAPASISLAAQAADSGGAVSKVEFFEGTNKLGEDTSAPYEFIWSNVAAGTYSLSAKATDDLGAIATSSAVGVSVAALPAAPSNLAAAAISKSQINLSWTDNSSNESGFSLERSSDGTTFTALATLDANASSYSNTGLAAATTYYYRLRAFNDAGTSAYTASVSATTSAAPSGAPTISSFSPTRGTPGTTVVINGTNLSGATSVKFNGRAATFTINSSTRITATAPNLVDSGPITVTTPSGTARSAINFRGLLP